MGGAVDDACTGNLAAFVNALGIDEKFPASRQHVRQSAEVGYYAVFKQKRVLTKRGVGKETVPYDLPGIVDVLRNTLRAT